METTKKPLAWKDADPASYECAACWQTNEGQPAAYLFWAGVFYPVCEACGPLVEIVPGGSRAPHA